jgi:antigen flippase
VAVPDKSEENVTDRQDRQPPTGSASTAGGSSYSRIVKSSALVGGVQLTDMLLGLVRAKVVAVFLGPAGLGVLAMLLSIRETAYSLSNLGIQQSGMRDVAEAHGSDNARRVAEVGYTLRRICWLFGTLGLIVLCLLRNQISQWAFHSTDHATEIAMVGIAVLFASVAGAQKSIIQGTRRIEDLTRVNILSAAFGTVAAVAFYVAMGVDGIVLAIVSMSAIDLVVSWLVARKIDLDPIRPSWRSSVVAAGGLVALGVTFMWQGLMLTGVDLATRSLLTLEFGLFAVGVMTAAYRVSVILVRMVLTAMIMDFIPALSAASSDPPKMCRLINEQTEIGLLMACPFLLVSLALGPWLIPLLYSSEFHEAVPLVRWFVPGCLLMVLSWPAAFVPVAQGRIRILVVTQTLLAMIHLALVYLGIKWVGVEGVAIAFVVYNVVYLTVFVAIASKLIGLRWSADVYQAAVLSGALLLFVVLLFEWLGGIAAMALGLLVTFVAGVYCTRQIARKLGVQHRLVRALSRLPFSRALIGVGPTSNRRTAP